MHKIRSQVFAFICSIVAFMSVAGYQLLSLASRLDASTAKLSEYFEHPVAVLLGTLTPAFIGTFVLYYVLCKSFLKNNDQNVLNRKNNWVSYAVLGLTNLSLLLVAVLVFVGGYGIAPKSFNDSVAEAASNISVRNQPCYLLINKGSAVRVNDELNGYVKVNYDNGLMHIYFEPGTTKEAIGKFIDSNEKELLRECGLEIAGVTTGVKK